jgi:hypothetical protein
LTESVALDTEWGGFYGGFHDAPSAFAGDVAVKKEDPTAADAGGCGGAGGHFLGAGGAGFAARAVADGNASGGIGMVVGGVMRRSDVTWEGGGGLKVDEMTAAVAEVAESLIAELVGMGFPRERAEEALMRYSLYLLY